MQWGLEAMPLVLFWGKYNQKTNKYHILAIRKVVP